MKVGNTNYSLRDIKAVLTRKGYRLEKHTTKVWNHEDKTRRSPKDFKEITGIHALLGDEEPNETNTIQAVFTRLVNKKKNQSREEFLADL